MGLDGNSIAVVSSEGVLVFDTNGTPAASAVVLGGFGWAALWPAA